MPGKERRRQLERERYQRQVTRRIRKDERNRTVRAVITSVLIVVVVVGGMTFLALTLSKKDRDDPSALPTKESSQPAEPTPTPAAANTCAYAKVPAQAGKQKDVGTPPKKPVKAEFEAKLATNRGDITVTLDGKKAPCTVNSFDFLANKKFFDATPCHRVVNKQIYVLQCGKPKGQAQGPGYQYTTENITGATYKKGTLAMANSGTPDSNGSQFFIVYKDSPLPPQYTVFGHVTGGIGMVEKVAKGGVTKEDPQVGGGPPKKKVTIKSVTVEKA